MRMIDSDILLKKVTDDINGLAKQGKDEAVKALNEVVQYIKQGEEKTPPDEVWIDRCFNCRGHNICWDNDFTFEDYGIDGEGLVHVLHCMDCGAEIEYYCREGEEF